MKSEIGDTDRFIDGERLCNYAGLAPSTHVAGGIMQHRSIAKSGRNTYE